MLLNFTDDDLHAMELERLDKERENPHPNLDDISIENADMERLYMENREQDPDYEAKILELLQLDADENQRVAQEATLWRNVAPFAPPSSQIERMVQVTNSYFPPELPPREDPPTESEQKDEKQQLNAQSEKKGPQKKEPTKRPSSYDVAQELLARETILIHRDAVYFFDGLIYRLMKKEEILRLIVRHCRSAVKEVGAPNFVQDIYKFILSEPNICVQKFEPSPDEVVFLDGVCDLRTLRLKPHTPMTYSTRLLQVNYQQGIGKGCPNFDRFVKSIAQGNRTLEHRIWQALGYLLVEDQRAKCFILLQGVHDSGKSVFGRFVKSFFDMDSISGLELHALDGNFSKSDLMGKALWLDLDLPSGALKEKAISELKKITGGDPLSADIKYMPRATFINRAKVLFATNHALLSDACDEAFERRIIVIPFTRTIPQDEQDFDLDAKLWQERDAVAVKAIHAFLDLKASKYQFAGNYPINAIVSPGEDLVSKIMSFVSEHCEEAERWVPTDVFYAAFTSIYGPICNKNTFSERFYLCSLSIYPHVSRKRDRLNPKGNPLNGYKGISLKSIAEPEESNE